MNDGDDLVPPASSRKPRSLKDELPLDDGLPGILDPDAEPMPESEERPPASRKVASVRSTDVSALHDFSTWEIDGIAAEPPPTRKAGWIGGERKSNAGDVRVRIERSSTNPAAAATPEAVRRALPEGDLVRITNATSQPLPETFGDWLDATLSLG